tara:strand:- start:42 stop:506 length:465 start_codon:yes stop_codon:yes gene_type:complete
MIIDCPRCKKKFEVDSNLIPEKGRLLKCGNCNHSWFFDKTKIIETKVINIPKDNIKTPKKDLTKQKNVIKNSQSIIKRNIKKSSAIVKYEKKSEFSFSIFLSYIVVSIITFIAIIIIIDTFKNPLYDKIPQLEFILTSLFETLKDIKLFIKDLV